MSKPTDLVQGTLDLLLLRVLSLEPMHGWAIAQRARRQLVLPVSDNYFCRCGAAKESHPLPGGTR